MRNRARLTAALALAVSLGVAGCADGSSDDTGTTASTGSDRSEPVGETATDEPAAGEIPAGFPLSAGMGGPEDVIPTSRTGTGLRDLVLCGTAPLRGLGARDRMVADNSGGESANTRELVLLGSADEAASLSQAIADLPLSCPTVSADGDTETLTEVRESPFAPSPATTLVQTYTFDGEPGSGATVVHVVPVGAALLVTSTYGQWAPDGEPAVIDVREAVDQTVEPLRETVSALDVFDDGTAPTDEPGDEPTDEPSGSATADPVTTKVPADFPLAVGLPEDDGETTVSAPSRDGEGVGEVEMCGQVVWPLEGAGRLATAATGPEYFDGRELVVHEDADAAVEAMAAVRQAAEECRSSGNQVWTVLDRDTGYDTVTMGLTYDDGLGSSVFQVTRVGSARLMVSTYGEGSLASLDAQADRVTETSDEIVPAMCVFTKTGC